jgi:uncharacterized repeat protein (TIGR03803 family)
MRNLVCYRYAFCICVTLALLAGCGGSQLPIGASSLAKQAVRGEPLGTPYAILHSFGKGRDGALPVAALTPLGGHLYGTTFRGGYSLGTVYKVTTSGIETVLHRFKPPPDGSEPEANLLAVNDTLYGTLYYGGGGSAPGAVFAITPAGRERVIYAFKKPPDVSTPISGLVELGGKMYGSAEFGGAQQDFGGVFEVTTSGKERVVHRFTGAPGDGGRASADLIIVNGVLYGVTAFGGSHDDGVIFSLTPSKVERVLYSFKGGRDGVSPNALTLLNGTLYGTTMEGGDNSCSQGCGTIFAFKIGVGERVIHYFKLNEGTKPAAGLLAYKGQLYGTTCAGGLYGNGESCWGGSGFQVYGVGTVFRISTSGAFTVLHSFDSQSGDGETPMAPLVALNGALYGTTENGGSYALGYGGTVFRISP